MVSNKRINLINNSTTPVKFYHYDKCNLGLPIGRIEKVDQSNKPEFYNNFSELDILDKIMIT